LTALILVCSHGAQSLPIVLNSKSITAILGLFALLTLRLTKLGLAAAIGVAGSWAVAGLISPILRLVSRVVAISKEEDAILSRENFVGIINLK
jgi:4-hydroxybenzoate polyprenyltransferase